MGFFGRFRESFSTADKREQWSWCMYDFAKSPFESVLTIFIGPYITYLTQYQACETRASATCEWCPFAKQCLTTYWPTNSTAVGCWPDACSDDDNLECCGSEGDYVHLGSTRIAYSAFFAFVVSASVIIQIVFLPFFSAIGEAYNPKKFLVSATVFASLALFAFLGTNKPGLYWVAALLYIIVNVCYGICNIFYNATLVYIAYPDERDSVSSKGFAVGYSGGIIFLIIALILYLGGKQSETMITSIIALVGLWWALWAILPFVGVRSTVAKEVVGEATALKPTQNRKVNIFKQALQNLAAAVRVLKKTPYTALYLAAASIYNDGISTIGAMAPVYATEMLDATPVNLIISVFIINIMAIVGAMFFNKLREWLNSVKMAIFIGIVIYIGIALYAYFLKRVWEIYIIGAIIGFALGGTQALSRSLLSVIIPLHYESEIFSLYEITQRGTSWMGPFVYGAMVTRYDNNHRPAMLTMIVFLGAGALLLLLVNVSKAREQAAAVGGGPKKGDLGGSVEVGKMGSR